MVRVWSLAGGRVLRSWLGIGSPSTVAISPNGSQVAIGGAGVGNSFAVYIYGRESGDLLHRVDGLPDWVRNMAYSPDGRYLAVTLRGGNGVRVYETSGYGEAARDEDYNLDSFGVAFDAGGRLATTSIDGRVRLYDRDFSLVREVNVEGGQRPWSIAFSPDSRQLAVGYHGEVRVDILDADTLERHRQITQDGAGLTDLSYVAWSPDGQYLWAGAWTNDGEGLLALRWPSAELTLAIRFDVDGVDVGSNELAVVHPLQGGRALVASHEVGDPFLALINADGTTIWERRRPTVDFEVAAVDRPVRVSADGAVVQFAYEPDNGRLAQFDVRTGTLDAADGSSADLAPPQDTAPGFAIGDWWNGVMPSVDGHPFDLRLTDDPLSWAVAPDEQAFAFGVRHRLYLFDREGRRLWWAGVAGAVWSVAVSGDGRLVVAALGDGTIRWYDRETGIERLVFFPHAGGERWVAWTPEGFYAASAGDEDLLAYLLDRRPRTLLGQLLSGDARQAPLLVTGGQVRDVLLRPDLIAQALDADRSVIRQAASDVGDIRDLLTAVADDESP